MSTWARVDQKGRANREDMPTGARMDESSSDRANPCQDRPAWTRTAAPSLVFLRIHAKPGLLEQDLL